MSWKQYRWILALFLFLVVFGAVFAGSYLLSVMIAIGILVMLLIGLDLMYGYCGQVDFGHQAYYAIGGYTSAILIVKAGIPAIVALPAGIALSCLVAYLIGKIVFRLKGYYFILATMVFGLVVYYQAAALGQWTGGVTGMSVPNLAIGGLVIQSELQYYCVVWGVALIMLIISLNIVRGRIGRALKAISVSELAASALAIDSTKYLLQMYVLGAAFASIAGSLLVHHDRFVVAYYFTLGFMVTMLVALVIGGKGTIWGSLLGATIMTLLPEFMSMFRTYQTLVYGAIFVITLTLLPNGLAGVIKSLLTRWHIRRSAISAATRQEIKSNF